MFECMVLTFCFSPSLSRFPVKETSAFILVLVQPSFFLDFLFYSVPPATPPSTHDFPYPFTFPVVMVWPLSTELCLKWLFSVKRSVARNPPSRPKPLLTPTQYSFHSLIRPPLDLLMNSRPVASFSHNPGKFISRAQCFWKSLNCLAFLQRSSIEACMKTRFVCWDKREVTTLRDDLYHPMRVCCLFTTFYQQQDRFFSVDISATKHKESGWPSFFSAMYFQILCLPFPLLFLALWFLYFFWPHSTTFGLNEEHHLSLFLLPSQ